MSTTEPDSPVGEDIHRGALCSKCEHLNPHGVSECRRCGAHLFISCVDCGARNERVRTRCRSCGRRLHRPLVERMAGRLKTRNLDFNPVVLVLFLFAILLALAFIRFVAGASIGGFN